MNVSMNMIFSTQMTKRSLGFQSWNLWIYFPILRRPWGDL